LFQQIEDRREANLYEAFRRNPVHALPAGFNPEAVRISTVRGISLANNHIVHLRLTEQPGHFKQWRECFAVRGHQAITSV
jgi:hypothetical protein